MTPNLNSDTGSALRVAWDFLRETLRGRRLLYICLCITAGGVFTLSTVVAPLLIRRLIGLFDTGQGTTSHIVTAVVLLGGLYLLRGGGRYAYGWLSHVVSYEVMHDLITQVYAHIQTLSHSFLNRQRSGDLVARSVSDVETVEDFVAHGIPEISMALLGPIIMTGVLVTIDPGLTALALLPLPLASLILFRGARRIRRFWWSVRAGLADLVAQIQDNLGGLTEIKLFNQEESRLRQVDGASRKFRDASINAMGISMVPGSIVEFSGGLGLMLVVGAGGYWTLQERLSLADFFLFVSYISFIYMPFMHLADLVDKISRAVVSLERTRQLLRVEPDIVSPPRRSPVMTWERPADWTVEFEDVHFTYRGDAPTLDGVSFLIEPNSKVALAGPTGAGKTTVTRLIPRLYDVDSGHVLVGGRDVRDWPLDSLRGLVSLVLQEVFLFHGTVRQNLLLGKPEAEPEELELAIETARAAEFIDELPYGLDTMIGERGVRLSGGQRQRVSIARALLKDAPILILDEATSNLDAVTELELHMALQELMADRTTLVIAHRMSTVRHADHILFMEDGRITEQGSFSELAMQGAGFERMVLAQNTLESAQFRMD